MNDQNFFSVERLVEFGLGMAVAQQMVGMMNQTMQQMYVPGSIQSIPSPNYRATSVQATPLMSATYYVALNGRTAGPFSECELSALISRGEVTKDTLCWLPGLAAWQPVERTPQVLRLVALAPPPLPPVENI